MNKLTNEERDLVREQVANYHKYYDIIQNGEQYRIISPFENDRFASWEYVSQDKREVLFTFAVMRGFFPTTVQVKLPGLDPDLVYVDQKSGKEYSGDALMYGGLQMANDDYMVNGFSRKDGYSEVIHLKAK